MNYQKHLKPNGKWHHIVELLCDMHDAGKIDLNLKGKMVQKQFQQVTKLPKTISTSDISIARKRKGLAATYQKHNNTPKPAVLKEQPKFELTDLLKICSGMKRNYGNIFKLTVKELLSAVKTLKDAPTSFVGKAQAYIDLNNAMPVHMSDLLEVLMQLQFNQADLNRNANLTSTDTLVENVRTEIRKFKDAA